MYEESRRTFEQIAARYAVSTRTDDVLKGISESFVAPIVAESGLGAEHEEIGRLS